MPQNQSLVQAMRNRPLRGLPTPPAAMPQSAAALNAPTAPAGPRARERSPLTDLFPTFETIAGYFVQLPLDNDINFNPGVGPAVYGLKSVTVGKDYGCELALFGIEASLLPPDSSGAAATHNSKTAAQWCSGDKTSRQAAVVVGVDLPVQAGQWQKWPGCPVPGVHDDSAALVSGESRSQVLWFGHFPPGGLDPADGPIQRRDFSRSFAPFVRRITMGRRLDIALVVQGSALTWGVEDTVMCGYAAVQLAVGLTTNVERWGE